VDGRRPGVMAYAGIGMMNAVCVGAGLVAGWFIDAALGTLPLFLMLGLVAGAAAGALLTRAEFKRFS
jgi:F0F1-type ATP synthase assembly protein I